MDSSRRGKAAENRLKCPFCGGPNFNWAQYCDHCRASLPEGWASAVPPDKPVDVDPPKIPTMPPFNRWAFVAGIAGIFLYFKAAEVINPPPGAMVASVLAVHGSRILFTIYRHASEYWRNRTTTRWLRQFDATQRTAVLGTAALPIEWEHRLDDHGRPQQDGLIHRFTFSPVDKRELRVLTTTSVGAAAVIVATLAAVQMGAMMRSIATLSVLGLCVSAWFCRRASAILNRLFEVTPFALSEIHANGMIRRIVWAGGATLRNNARRRRIEVTALSSAFRIDIPYTVVGFARLAELIVEKGGFVPRNRAAALGDSTPC